MFSLTDILHSSIIVQTFFIAILLLTNRDELSTSNKILGGFMFLLSCYFSINAFFIFKHFHYTNYFFLIAWPLSLAMNPFYFYYVRSLTKEKHKYSKKDLLHFLPAALIFLINITTLTSGSFERNEFVMGFFKQDFLLNTFSLSTRHLTFIIYNLQILLYSFLMIRLLIQHKRNLDKYFSYKENISLDWLNILVICIICFSIFDILIFSKLFNVGQYLYFIIMLAYINFLGYFGIKQKEVYSYKSEFKTEELSASNELPEIDKTEEINSILTNKEDEGDENDNKYEKSSLSDDQKEKLKAEVLSLMEGKRMYLDSKLIIDDIAIKLKTNKKYISQVINEKFGKNFYNFVNDYRIEESLILMSGNSVKKFSIEGIASSVGFNSRSAFNNAFKKQTGQTPSDFIKSNT